MNDPPKPSPFKPALFLIGNKLDEKVVESSEEDDRTDNLKRSGLFR